MANLTITIPDAVLPRVLDAIASSRGYNPATDGTKAQFAKAQIIGLLKDIVSSAEAAAAEKSARATANNDIQLS